LAFPAVPQKRPLPQKYKELIFIAINVATTHLLSSGVRRHMRNALQAGATKEELLEVIQLTSIMGIHSMTMGVPILMEELEKFKMKS
jgi:alkylhydroperoxidase/carboxymuconolactone decarboxylase family protein YurZ